MHGRRHRSSRTTNAIPEYSQIYVEAPHPSPDGALLRCNESQRVWSATTSASGLRNSSRPVSTNHQQAGSPFDSRNVKGASCCFGGTMEWFCSLIYNFSICTPAQKVKRAATNFVSLLRLFQLITPTDPRGTGPPGFSGRWRPPRWAYPHGRSRRTTYRCS